MPRTAFELLCDHARETALLESIESLLHWDERTMMPPAAGAYRAEQITCLSGLVHRRQTDPRVGEWLDELAESPLAADPQSDTGATIRQLRRRYEKKTKLPQSLVEELTRAAVHGQQVWVEARKQNDFALFRPALERTIELKRQQAEAIGYDGCPYDALLDDFEPDAKTAEIETVLGRLRERLVPLIGRIVDSGVTPRREVLRRRFGVDAQRRFGTDAAARIGFDFQAGRIDVTEHPFCCGPGPSDCRITTRYDERFFPSAFFGILHEAGHGIYDQQLRKDQFGLPPGSPVSHGIHESQSRLWENQVGRSRAFWQCFFGPAQEAFPKALADTSPDDFYAAINDVRPSLIRVEADEATYNLHIVIRFELEQALLSGQLPVDEAPAAWNAKYRRYLGVEPKTDTLGVMQDVHWSAGLFGYFPSYSLGNLYAAQLFQAAETELGELNGPIAAGRFAPLREWLGRNVHQQGQCLSAGQLVERASGKPPSSDALLNYLGNKLGPLYGIS